MRGPLILFLALLAACLTAPKAPTKASVAQGLYKAQETALAQCTTATLPGGRYWDCRAAANGASYFLEIADVSGSPCAFQNAGNALGQVVDLLREYGNPVEESLSVPVLEAQILGSSCK